MGWPRKHVGEHPHLHPHILAHVPGKADDRVHEHLEEIVPVVRHNPLKGIQDKGLGGKGAIHLRILGQFTEAHHRTVKHIHETVFPDPPQVTVN